MTIVPPISKAIPLLLLTSFLLMTLLLSNGCSVGMALSGKDDPNLNVIRTGASRGEIELQLGDPVTISPEANGNTRCLYEFSQGKNPSAGRAIAHGAMDVLTLGIWEAVGTPIEGFKGSKKRIQIVYNADNKVTDIISAAPAPVVVEPPKEAQEAKQ
ncbi:MAG: hypothetical protein ACYC6G_13940 [Desulfobaccales bacterium]